MVVTVTPLVPAWGRWLAGPFDDPKGDILIVLGSSATNGGILSSSSYWRSAYGVLAYREGGFRKIVVSGGADRNGNPIGAPMADFLAFEGVPRDKIVLESRSTSTRENAIYTSQLLRGVPGSKVLLTSDYHMFRAARVFRKAGLPVLLRPYPDVLKRATSWQGRWPAFLDLVSETAKIVYYRLAGWM